ncbi:MAG: hypothetical protein ACR2QW_16935, partial [bacterium]
MIKKFAMSLLLLSFSSASQAATFTTFTVKSDFLAATVGISLLTEEFEAVVGEPSFANNTSLVVNDITLLSTHGGGPIQVALFNKIDQQPPEFVLNDPSGSTFAHALTFNAGDYFSISFDNPTNVFAADLGGINDGR